MAGRHVSRVIRAAKWCPRSSCVVLTSLRMQIMLGQAKAATRKGNGNSKKKSAASLSTHYSWRGCGFSGLDRAALGQTLRPNSKRYQYLSPKTKRRCDNFPRIAQSKVKGNCLVMLLSPGEWSHSGAQWGTYDGK